MDATIPATINGGTRGGLAIWLPWLLSPACLLLPIGGCGVAAAVRRPQQAAARQHQAAPVPATEAVATVGTIAPHVR
jgi:hypothetical protein